MESVYDPSSYERNICNIAYGNLKNSGLQLGLNLWPGNSGAML